jgi:hypothetical protein
MFGAFKGENLAIPQSAQGLSDRPSLDQGDKDGYSDAPFISPRGAAFAKATADRRATPEWIWFGGQQWQASEQIERTKSKSSPATACCTVARFWAAAS